MKKTKVIIPALGILLLSTAASVTGTVAWFSANSTVHATSMKVTALSSNLFLQICNSAEESVDAAKTTAEAVTAAAQIAPADYKAIGSDGTVTWGNAISNDPNLVNYTTKETLTAIDNDDLGNYVWSDTFYFWTIASNGQTAKNLKLKKVNISGNDEQTDMMEALRVLVVGGDAAMLYHYSGASENGTSLSTTNLIDVIDFKAPATLPDDYVAPTGIISAVPNGYTYKAPVKVYIYFNGNDDSCTSNKAQDLDQLTISLDFDVDSASV